MPTYQYNCSDCSHEFEQMQKITDEALRHCPKCQKDALKRGPGGGVGLSFSGSGFYINDYGSGKEHSTTPKPSCCPCGKGSGSCSK